MRDSAPGLPGAGKADHERGQGRVEHPVPPRQLFGHPLADVSTRVAAAARRRELRRGVDRCDVRGRRRAPRAPP